MVDDVNRFGFLAWTAIIAGAALIWAGVWLWRWAAAAWCLVSWLSDDDADER